VRTQRFYPIIHGKASTFSGRLRTTRFAFHYTFASGGELWGRVTGDRLYNAPALVFNLRDLQATYRDSQGHCQPFDTVYGQFNLDFPGALLTGSNATTGAFFSFTYRGQEATVYDDTPGGWLSECWQPERWQVQEVPAIKSVPLPLSPRRVPQSA
jgi:hypothetical protein